MREDLTALRAPEPAPFSRRGFVVTSLAVGYAAAVSPVSADTITTDSKGLVAGEVKIPVADGTIPAYRAMPEGDKRHPVILVVQEIFGVHEHIKDICRRFGKLGFFAIAPELYARQGDVSKMTDFRQIISEVVSKVPDSQVMSDLDAAVKYADGTGKASTDKLGITGFCWGGRIVWLYAAHTSRLKAGVAWYGRLAQAPNAPASDLQPKYPIDLVGSLKAPVLGLYAGKDNGIPMATVEAMQTKLKEANSPSKIHVYPNAQHGFYADYRPSYSEEDAKDAWKRLQDWFKEHGVE